MMKVMLPVLSMRMNAFGAKLSVPCDDSRATPAGTWNARIKAPATAACKTKRREGFSVDTFVDIDSPQTRSFAGRALDGSANAHIRAAAADISGHRGVDVGIVRLGRVVDESGSRHDL